MGSKRFDGLGDYFRHKYRLRIECRGCNRVPLTQFGLPWSIVPLRLARPGVMLEGK